MLSRSQIPIQSLQVSTYKIPTDFRESDGTLDWDSTTLVLVQTSARGQQGLGQSIAVPHLFN